MCLPTRTSGLTIQRYATLAGNLLCLNFGLMFGITPPHAILYQTTTPLNRPINAEAASWLIGYMFMSAAIGALILGPISKKIGCKAVLQLSGLLQITSWFCLHFGFDIQHIYASRMFAGVAGGAVYTVLPIFINEITEDSHATATNIAAVQLMHALGILLGLIFGVYFNYDVVIVIGIVFSLVFALIFPFVQESPYYYQRKGNVMSMEKSLRWYRGIRHIDDRERPEFLREVEEFKRVMKESPPIVTSAVPCAYQFKLGFFCFVLLVGAQLAGVYVLLSYSMQSYDDAVYVFIFAGVQVIGALLAIWFGVKVNRKILLTITGLICGLSMIALIFAGSWPINSQHTSFMLTMGLLSLHILSASIGLQPLSLVVTCELLPTQLRVSFSSVIFSLSFLLLFALIVCFHYLIGVVQLITFFALFAGACFVVALVAFFILPDTRSKSMDEVQHDMGFEITESVAKITTVSGGQIHEYTHM